MIYYQKKVSLPFSCNGLFLLKHGQFVQNVFSNFPKVNKNSAASFLQQAEHEERYAKNIKLVI